MNTATNIIQNYLSDLLQEPPQAAPDPDRYRMVTLAGLRLLLPPPYADRVSTSPAAIPPGRRVDIRPVLFPEGHPARLHQEQARCWLELPEPGLVLWFGADKGLRHIDPESLAVPGTPTQRPWLLATVADLKAAIIDPSRLIECLQPDPIVNSEDSPI